MATIVTRTGKGSPLTHVEVDTNFTNLNTNKLEAGAIALGSAATPSISFTGDTNTGIYSPGADQLAVATNGTGRLFVNANGRVGVMVTPSTTFFHVYTDAPSTVSAPTICLEGGFNGYGAGIDFASRTSSGGTLVSMAKITADGEAAWNTTASTQDANLRFFTAENGSLGERARIRSDGMFEVKGAGVAGSSPAFSVNGSAPANSAIIDTSGRLLIGTPTHQGDYTLQIQGDATSANAAGCIYLRRGLNTAAIGGNVGAELGDIQFGANDGTVAARIECLSDAEWTSTSDCPGRLVFSTTPDGSASPTERMRITNSGAVLFVKQVRDYTTEGIVLAQGATSGTDTSFVTNAGSVVTFSRGTNDGTILSLRQDGTEEGTISVSGTTVSYNGAHLSRWSQLASGAERTEILRGSILSNLDEMCEWGEEDNEQLNRMKVSTVEGDKNVSGVFQSWDDDDDTYTNDFYCAMTGDFIIRIAEGVTVERGDLLMSAGDGTAKPQDDDIIRSKTIAKVTSINVSCTYEDGSYCVPCVLMAC